MLEHLNSPWAFGSVLAISLALCFIIWKAGTITFAKLGLTIGSSSKSVKKSPHANCPHSRDIMEIIHRTAEHYEKIQLMKNGIMKEQMRYYEEVEEEVLGLMKKIFIDMLIKKIPGDDTFIEHKDYKNYVLIIKVIASDLKSYVRNCFSMNHYTTYTIETQNDYVEKKKCVLIQKVTEALNDYWRGSSITRQEIFKANKENIRKFENQIEVIFNRAFSEARGVYARIEKEQKEYQSYIDFMIGVK